MTLFAFAPLRSRSYGPFVAFPEALDAREIGAWQAAAEALPQEVASVATAEGSRIDGSFRGASVAWLHPYPETWAIFDRLRSVAEQINRDHYSFDLAGLAEPLQYTVYAAPSVGYDWHEDMVDAPDRLQRKLSLTVQLSDPASYDGGDLELRRGAHVVTAPRAPGCVVAFPSWALHRVTPVTRGERRSLVAWVGGPAFR
jgi:PKHD-type hydroxylase